VRLVQRAGGVGDHGRRAVEHLGLALAVADIPEDAQGSPEHVVRADRIAGGVPVGFQSRSPALTIGFTLPVRTPTVMVDDRAGPGSCAIVRAHFGLAVDKCRVTNPVRSRDTVDGRVGDGRWDTRWVISSRQLEYFQAVARELHFTRAAEALRMAQPALSQQIRKLERQLGLTLFDRDNHRVALTPAGVALFAHAERVLSDLVAVEQEMLGWAGGVRGLVRVGAARGLMGRLALVLAAFCRTYPAIEVGLRELNTEEMLAGLRSGRLDVATLGSASDLGDRRLIAHPLGAEPLVLTAGPRHPLATSHAGQGPVPLAELDGLDLVRYPSGSAVGRIILTALTEAGVEPTGRFETSEYTTARELVAVGLTAAIMPLAVAAAPGAEVRVLRLEPEPAWTPSLAWSADRRPAPALRALIDFLIERAEFSTAGDISTV
jgi:DNA-binding transcriptional LysR family regulator